MNEGKSFDSSAYEAKGKGDVPVTEGFDPHETIARWQMSCLGKEDHPVQVKPESIGKWPDEESQQARERLLRKGVDLPWGYREEFGDKDFKVTGLRAGGTGVVYFLEFSGQDRKRLYAAKTLHSFLKPDYLDLSPPLQEKVSLAFLEETLPWLEMGQHPHIVSVQLLKNIVHPEFKRNVPFIFSEFIPRGNLKGYLGPKESMTTREALKLGIQLCDGLLHAYSHGLESHRDIKPENILVYDDGLFQVTDFGASVIGTPGYMAPEQVAALWHRRGKKIGPNPIPVDHRTDQFALGLVILESFLGRHPFSICRDAVTDRDQAKRYMDDGVGEIADDSLKGILREILTRALSTNPDNRYPDISSLRGELMELYETEYGTYGVPEVAKDDSASWWYHRGEAFLTLGRSVLAEVPFGEALERCSQISGTDLDRAKCRMQLGMVYRETSRLLEAETESKEALSLFCRISGAELEQTRCIMNLGIIHFYTSHFPEAEKEFEKALEILRSIPETELQQASCTLNMGIIYNHTGRYPDAERVYKKALEIYRRIPGTEIEQARCTQNLGITFSTTCRYSEAEKAYKEALDIYSRIPGNEFEVGICTMNLGAVYHVAGRFREAEELLEETMKIYRGIPGIERDRAMCIGVLASVYRDTGRYPKAEETINEALRLYQCISGTDLDRAMCAESLGNIYRDTGRGDKAEKAYQDALSVYNEFPGTELIRGRCTSELARYYRSIEDIPRARDLAEEALKLCEPFPPESTEKIRADCQAILQESKGDKI